MKSAHLVTITTMVLMSIAGLLAYFYLPLESGEIRLPVVDGCALHLEACSVDFPQGGSMTFEIKPLRPSPTDPLKLKASFDQMVPQTVGARFKGVDMNMGYLEHYVNEMQQHETAEQTPSFIGNGGVFACSNGMMQWHVLVRVRTGDGVAYEVPFKFETMWEHPGVRCLILIPRLKIKDLSPVIQVSLTDPDVRFMATSGRGSGLVGYNVQAGSG